LLAHVTWEPIKEQLHKWRATQHPDFKDAIGGSQLGKRGGKILCGRNKGLGSDKML